MHIKFPMQKGMALAELGYGESLLVPCNDRTVQSVQSSIQSLYAKKGLSSREFSQRKALLILDEHMLPVPVVVVTRKRAELLEEVPA
ncbi:hypothetical protein DXO206_023240 (plasmid) [Xanthomonas oryzae pv. oryzae]|uniref:hypothetical protein n=3 Tax=Xanthomonas oryzae TaxID=347 RepID=UPI00094A0528|nr:hypothetical protein EBA18_24730 [Xanthomonas oryzae pv. oryzae]QEJ71004.1 hypothetical protein BXO1_024850 [Xanthomonas oryzae pv. oryzae]WJS66016.1 hypothetical protein DXO206_023240 [Xanthomonas oryzae pv. oryzae]